MKEFNEDSISKYSVSDLERMIRNTSEATDELVFALYSIDGEAKEMLREMYRCKTLSEYFDRLEEYVGLEDMTAN